MLAIGHPQAIRLVAGVKYSCPSMSVGRMKAAGLPHTKVF
jgi:hypothetical protein